MRTTVKYLRHRVQTLNMMLGRPLGVRDVGSLHLDKNSAGCQLVEIASSSGGERVWTDRLSTHKMNIALDGIIIGIALQSSYIGETIIRTRLKQADKGDVGAMYSELTKEQHAIASGE